MDLLSQLDLELQAVDYLGHVKFCKNPSERSQMGMGMLLLVRITEPGSDSLTSIALANSLCLLSWD